MQVVALLTEAPDGMSVTGVGKHLGLEKSIASRLLGSLEMDGYVARDQLSDRYRLTLKVLTLALRYADVLGFPELCVPILQGLAQQTGELIQLAAREGDHLFYVAGAEGRQRLNIRPIIGREVVPHATASGRAWLATLSTDHAIVIALAGGMTQETPRTKTRISDLLVELERVKRQGFATVADEWADGISAVAAAIGVQRFGSAVGTVVMSVPSSRYDLTALSRLGPQLVAAATDLERVWPITMASAVQGANATG